MNYNSLLLYKLTKKFVLFNRVDGGIGVTELVDFGKKYFSDFRTLDAKITCRISDET